MIRLTLPTDSKARKRVPLLSGVLRYAPAALAGVAEVSVDGNDKHNPGQELHHARGKSADHGDCVVRHLVDVQDILAFFERDLHDVNPEDVKILLTEVNQATWRMLMLSQELHEKYGGAPLAPAARLPAVVAVPARCPAEATLREQTLRNQYDPRFKYPVVGGQYDLEQRRKDAERNAVPGECMPRGENI